MSIKFGKIKGYLARNVRLSIYLLTVRTCDSISIHGAYNNKSILLKDYNMLIKTDKRFSQQVSIDNIKIYKLELNKFYGE